MDENEILYNVIKEAAKIQLPIEKLKARLTGNPQQDRQIVFSAVREMNNHEYSEVVIKKIREEVYGEYFTYEELQQFSFVSRTTNFINNLLGETHKLMQIGKLTEAIQKLDEFIYSTPFLFQETDLVEYHNFSNPLEETLFFKDFNPEKEVMPIPNNQQYVALYYIYGALLLQFQRYGESAYFLELASSLNPVLSTIYFERAEIFKLKKDFKSFLKYTNNALRYASSSQFLARGYRNLGFYYIEKDNLELAAALFKFSLIFENNDMAYTELNFIESLGYNTSQRDNDFINILNRNDIQMGPSDLVFDTLIELIKKAQEENNLSETLSLYSILYDLTKDENIKKTIDQIRNNM